MWDAINTTGCWTGEVWNRKKTGELYAELLSISTIFDDLGKPLNYIGVFTDITQNKKQQEKLNLMAYYDLLTGLPNRALFTDRFHQAIAHSNRSQQQLAVCYLDLDNFKPINDNFGHAVGDKLLIEVANRIQSCTRAEDTISRQGGDEFTLLLNDVESFEECEKTLKRLLHTLAQPYVINGYPLNITASCGLTLYPSDDSDIDTLLRHADQAMYQSKQAGRNRYYLFNAQLDAATTQKHNRLAEIKQALTNNEFELYYQPKVNMITGEVFGAEALIRWIHPEKGIIPPLDFLPFIDGTTLEIDIGKWVVGQALTQATLWKNKGTPLQVSVNISSFHLLTPSFIDDIEAALYRHEELAPAALQLEILESTVLGDLTQIGTVIKTCRERLGVHVALDDFGTGYSSLTHLRNLSADTIKIDQTFVRDVLDDPNDFSIIDAVIGLANAFNCGVIAEGVETTEHGLILLAMGCKTAQGYGIARPMPADNLDDWLKAYQPNKQWLDESIGQPDNEQLKAKIFALTSKHWAAKFEAAINLTDESSVDWPIMKNSHSEFWIKRAKEESIFSVNWLNHFESLYSTHIKFAHQLMEQHQAGHKDLARSGLDKFRENHTALLQSLKGRGGY